jgi:hypothetical protein
MEFEHRVRNPRLFGESIENGNGVRGVRELDPPIRLDDLSAL